MERRIKIYNDEERKEVKEEKEGMARKGEKENDTNESQ